MTWLNKLNVTWLLLANPYSVCSNTGIKGGVVFAIMRDFWVLCVVAPKESSIKLWILTTIQTRLKHLMPRPILVNGISLEFLLQTYLDGGCALKAIEHHEYDLRKHNVRRLFCSTIFFVVFPKFSPFIMSWRIAWLCDECLVFGSYGRFWLGMIRIWCDVVIPGLHL